MKTTEKEKKYLKLKSQSPKLLQTKNGALKIFSKLYLILSNLYPHLPNLSKLLLNPFEAFQIYIEIPPNVSSIT